MSNSSFENLNADELLGIFSDFHKDYYGYRPRWATAEQCADRDWLMKQIDSIHDAMDELKKTPEGRAELRANGWVIDEKEFV
jgi:hypothetical protein